MIHHYEVDTVWTGNRGPGTTGYRAYDRDYTCRAGDKPLLSGSADPHFLGDAARWNPEELLVAGLSACHQLWYLHLCADAGVVVEAYRDRAIGIMEESGDGGGAFTRVTLRPRVTVTPASDPARAQALHAEAAALCFIARSVAFEVDHEPELMIAGGDDDSHAASTSATVSSGLVDTIDRYCAVWSFADAPVRAEWLGSVWGEQSTYTDPTVALRGPTELLAHVARVHEARPGMVVARRGAIDSHHRIARFAWRASDGEGRTLVDGLDVVTFLEDGRLANVVGFFEDRA